MKYLHQDHFNTCTLHPFCVLHCSREVTPVSRERISGLNCYITSKICRNLTTTDTEVQGEWKNENIFMLLVQTLLYWWFVRMLVPEHVLKLNLSETSLHFRHFMGKLCFVSFRCLAQKKMQNFRPIIDKHLYFSLNFIKFSSLNLNQSDPRFHSSKIRPTHQNEVTLQNLLLITDFIQSMH